MVGRVSEVYDNGDNGADDNHNNQGPVARCMVTVDY